MAIRTGQRPTATILHDPYAGHRNWFTGEPDASPMWTEWDFALAEAAQIIEDHTDSHGVLIWQRDSDRVTFNAQKKIDKAQAAIDRKTKGKKNKPYEASDGEYWVVKPVLMRGEEMPTMAEYYEEQARLAGDS